MKRLGENSFEVEEIERECKRVDGRMTGWVKYGERGKKREKAGERIKKSGEHRWLEHTLLLYYNCPQNTTV